MRQEGLKAKGRKRRRYSSYKGQVGKIAPNIISRNFKATRPAEKLVSDITQFNVGTTKIYLSPLIDLFSGEVISWRIGKSPNMELALGMLEDALPIISGRCALIHTDQGFHYQNKRWSSLLKKMGCRQSMSRKGNCLDNAPAESFFGRLKTEFSDGSDYRHPNRFIKDLDCWIRWYNEKRIKGSNHGLTPIQYRLSCIETA
jgi:transposase InsO family protein